MADCTVKQNNLVETVPHMNGIRKMPGSDLVEDMDYPV
jgi:hypothetical protein